MNRLIFGLVFSLLACANAQAYRVTSSVVPAIATGPQLIPPNQVSGLFLALDPTQNVTTSGGLVTAIGGSYGTSVNATVSNPNQFALATALGPAGQNMFSYHTAGADFAALSGSQSPTQFSCLFALSYQQSGAQNLFSNSAAGTFQFNLTNGGLKLQLRAGPSQSAIQLNLPQAVGISPAILAMTWDGTNNVAQVWTNGVGPTVCSSSNPGGCALGSFSNISGPITFNRLGASANSWKGPQGPSFCWNRVLSSTEISQETMFMSNWIALQIYTANSGSDTSISPWLMSAPLQNVYTSVGLASGQTVLLRCNNNFRINVNNSQRALLPTATATLWNQVDGGAWCPDGNGTNASIRPSYAPTPTLVSGTIYSLGVIPSEYAGFNSTGSTIVSGGSGYTPGTQNLTITGGTCSVPPVVKVNVSAGGVVTGLSSPGAIVTGGTCTVWPSNNGGAGASLSDGTHTTATINAEYGCGGGTHTSCAPASECFHVAANPPTTDVDFTCGYVFYVPGGTPTYFANSVCPFCGTNVVRLTQDYTDAPNNPAIGHSGYDQSTQIMYVNVGVALNPGDIEVSSPGQPSIFPAVAQVVSNYGMWRRLGSYFGEFQGFDCNASICFTDTIDSSFNNSDGVDGHNSATLYTWRLTCAFNGRWLNGTPPVTNTGFGNCWSMHDNTTGELHLSKSSYNDQDGLGFPSGVNIIVDRNYVVGIDPFFINVDDCNPGPCLGTQLLTNNLFIVPATIVNPSNPVPATFSNGLTSSTTTATVKSRGNVYLSLSGGTLGSGLTTAGHATAYIDSQDDIVYGFFIGANNAFAGSTLNSNFNVYFGNGTNYSGVTPGANDIQANPLFGSVPLDLSLQTGSPALNAGTPASPPLSYDFPGNLRSLTNPSIGAYEQ